MPFSTDEILTILDTSCDKFTFPMLDNGYVYLAANRLTLHRTKDDWAMVIEVFGFSPRSGLPDTSIQTFASKLHDRDSPDRYINAAAYNVYLANHPHDEFRSAFPVEHGPWQDVEW